MQKQQFFLRLKGLLTETGKTIAGTCDFQVDKIATDQMVNTVDRTDLLVISNFAVASI